MSVTDDAIENLADAFCKISKPEHREIFVEGLQAIARMSQAELINRMQLSYAQMSVPLDYLRH